MPRRLGFVIAVVSAILPSAISAQVMPLPLGLGRIWDAEHLRLPPPPLMRHADVIAALQKLQHDVRR